MNNMDLNELRLQGKQFIFKDKIFTAFIHETLFTIK